MTNSKKSQTSQAIHTPKISDALPKDKEKKPFAENLHGKPHQQVQDSHQQFHRKILK
ncbi:hypothetical protein HCJ66_13630 [Listeria sp. FSL L7-1582]|uniref:Uncharacterized protein n=2 Tax=Listeria TaxID=1637 RepID=A0A841YUZ7_9LIST|nr:MULTISPECIES: hypothetical protein [Listeria]KMT61699.1 hypothetical protein X559_1935 [Listeria newyorkensis]MBA3927368.1 hypothetical protein [Listeria rustica]MBC1456792.1 hypothetical protein [Listeria newyorkensis]MBC6310574.1 hypothetical protein [Listeria portnoyi]WAO21993.1 hypothetical protein OTR81_01460 [Listeria newyorkensis]